MRIQKLNLTANSKKKESDFKARALTAIVFVIVVLALISVHKYTLACFFILVAIGCSYEYLKLFLANSSLALIISLTLAGGLIYLITIKNMSTDLFLSAFTLAFMIYSFISLYFKKGLKIHKFFPVGMCLSLIVTPLYLLGSHIYFSDDNYKVILFLLLMIWSADSFAYLVGRKIGKRKLFPSVSPNKSWEGFLASGIITLFLGIIIGAYMLPEISYVGLVLLILSAWLIGGIGDLVQSSVKRYTDVKDSGQLLPGHGGVWDRFDSFIFMCPMAYLILKYIA